MHEADYEAAAAEYLRLAKLYPRVASRYQLLAAQAYLRGREIDRAGALLAAIEADELEETGKTHLDLLVAYLLLEQGDTDHALSMTTAALPASINGELRWLRHNVRARAFAARGEPAKAIVERMLQLQFAATGESRQRAVDRIWSGLGEINKEQLDTLANNKPDAVASWIELYLLADRYGTAPTLLEPALNSWMIQYPGHPAIPILTGQLLSTSRLYQLRPSHVALLLPQSGVFKDAAQAIRDGFMAAWYRNKDYQPRITVLDAHGLNILPQYTRAVDSGADFVIGPLEKAAVAALLTSGRIKVPTLALNRADFDSTRPVGDGSLPALVEFGLAPEDEAQQAAQRAFFDGHLRALVLTPNTEWGRRLGTAFTEEWRALGGMVLKHVEYSESARDYTIAAKAILNVNSSEYRTARLRQKLRLRLNSTPRIRQDADMIFMAAVSVAAKQLVPQFRFFRADDFPVYSTSHIFTGTKDPKSDRDMDGVRFPDMPWVVEVGGVSEDLRKTMESSGLIKHASLIRLYALGADAFTLIPNLGRLYLETGSTYQGLTGTLKLLPEGRIYRQLTWVQYVDGVPRPLD